MSPDIFGVGAIPAILGLTQVAKETGMPGRFSPILSLFLGILAGVALQFARATAPSVTGVLVLQGVIVGIGIGLAASGLYSGVQTFVSPTPVPPVPPPAT